MKRFSAWLASGLAVAALSAMTAPVRAQDTVPVVKPISIKAGAYFFTDGDVKDTVGSSALYLGLSYDFTKTAVDTPTLFQAYLDYASKSRSGVRATMVGLGGAARYIVRSPNTSVQPYLGAGIGLYYVEGKGGGDKSDKTSVGGKLFGGVQSNMGLFGEVDYTITPSIEGDRLDGIGARVGYRF